MKFQPTRNAPRSSVFQFDPFLRTSLDRGRSFLVARRHRGRSYVCRLQSQTRFRKRKETVKLGRVVTPRHSLSSCKKRGAWARPPVRQSSSCVASFAAPRSRKSEPGKRRRPEPSKSREDVVQLLLGRIFTIDRRGFGALGFCFSSPTPPNDFQIFSEGSSEKIHSVDLS